MTADNVVLDHRTFVPGKTKVYRFEIRGPDGKDQIILLTGEDLYSVTRKWLDLPHAPTEVGTRVTEIGVLHG